MKNKINFSLFDAKFSVSFPFLAMICLMFMFDEKQNSLGTMIAFAVHELSHIIAILLFGGRFCGMHFALCEMDIETDKESLNRIQNFIVSVSGAFANFVLAWITYESNFNFAMMNIVIGSFQLLPVESLDGSSALESLGVSEKCRKMISIFTAFIFALLGFYILIQTKYNFSVLVISLYLIFLSFTCKSCEKIVYL